MKELLEGGLINRDCLTVTGNTVAENLSSVPCVSDLETQACVYKIYMCACETYNWTPVGCTFSIKLSYSSCWTSYGNSTGKHKSHDLFVNCHI